MTCIMFLDQSSTILSTIGRYSYARAAPPAWERGAKDVVLVDAGESVRVIMRFDDFTTDGWPFMYHCHNLLHEDNMMMAQCIVVDPNVSTQAPRASHAAVVFPSPTSGSATYHAPFEVKELLLVDHLGRTVVQRSGLARSIGTIDLGSLPAGPYVLVLRSEDRQVRSMVVKE